MNTPKFRPGDLVRVLAPTGGVDAWTGKVMRVIEVHPPNKYCAQADYYLARLSDEDDWEVSICEQRLTEADHFCPICRDYGCDIRRHERPAYGDEDNRGGAHRP